jgi:hypothetical protein
LWCRFAIGGYKFAKIHSDISGNRWYESTKTASQLLDLLAEAVSVQQRIFGKVSAYFVQAISDNLYARLHAKFHSDANHIIFRLAYFKVMWVLLNYRSPWYCLKGLLSETIAKSGPIVNDKLTFRDLAKGLKKALCKNLR